MEQTSRDISYLQYWTPVSLLLFLLLVRLQQPSPASHFNRMQPKDHPSSFLVSFLFAVCVFPSCFFEPPVTASFLSLRTFSLNMFGSRESFTKRLLNSNALGIELAKNPDERERAGPPRARGRPATGIVLTYQVADFHHVRWVRAADRRRSPTWPPPPVAPLPNGASCMHYQGIDKRMQMPRGGMICASIRSEADAIYTAGDNRPSRWGYSVCGKLSLAVSDSRSHKRIPFTKGA